MRHLFDKSLSSLRSIKDAVQGRTQNPHARRIQLTVGCRDCDGIPKAPNAGRVIQGPQADRVQVMHEGTLVVAGGYHGDWMSEIIRTLQGHHEPQEELIFHHVLKSCAQGSLMIEIGAFWAYYTAWWLGAIKNSRAVCVEPDDNNRAIGEKNLSLNGRTATWISSLVGARQVDSMEFQRESDGALATLPCHHIDSLLDTLGRPAVEMLHIDCQGAELGFLSTIHRAIDEKLLRFVFVSTHHESISSSRTTHGDCLRLLIDAGAVILAEHTVDESFSGDGLIVASFRRSDADLRLPRMSLNHSSNSLFAHGPTHPKQLLLRQTEHGPMVLAADDKFIGAALQRSGASEENLIRQVVGFLMKHHGFSPKVFVDAGANIGTHLLCALKNGLFARGIGIEMDSLNYRLLVSNVALNDYLDRTRLINSALADVAEEKTMELSPDNRGDHRLRNPHHEQIEHPEAFGESSRATCKVLSTTLDRIAADSTDDLNAGTLVWMDVQGHEGHAMDGAKRILQQESSPFFVVELWPYGLNRSGGMERLMRFLKSCRAVYDIRSKDWENRPLDFQSIQSLVDELLQSPNPALHTDLLCIPQGSSFGANANL